DWLISEIISQSFRTIPIRSFNNASTFSIVSSETDGRPELCASWASIFEFSAPFAQVLYDHILFSIDSTQLGRNVHRCSVFCTQNKESQNGIRTWREKRGEAPSVTASKSKMASLTVSRGGYLERESQAIRQYY
ncbi:hypothetical protein NPIL_491981, partial [Nephila pilipes]